MGAAAAALRRGTHGLKIIALEMTLFERVHLPSFGGGVVVLVNLWTLTCINWPRHETGGDRQDEQAWRRRQDRTP